MATATDVHLAKHGEGVCDKFTGSVLDYLVYCPGCGEPMEHHCCHRCCLTCSVMESPRAEF